MPPTLSLPQFSGRQIEATSGFRPRLAYADLLRDELPNFYAARQAGQQNRALDLSEQQMEQQNRLLDIQAKSLQSQEEAQASAQKQQTIGSGIQAVGTLGQGALAAKQLGLFGSKTATGLSSTATQAPSLAVGASTGTAVLPGAASEAAMSAGGVALDTGGAATAAATGTQAVAPVAAAGGAFSGTGGGLIGGAAGASVAGLAGAAGVGALAGYGASKLPIGGKAGKFGKIAIGGLVGAAGGFLVGGPFGAIAGGILGNLGGAGICIIHEAAYAVESPEVDIARAFRDTYLTRPMLRAYYHHYEPVAKKMREDVQYRQRIRHELTDRLVRYGAHVMHIPYKPLQAHDQQVAEAFLKRLRVIGEGMGAVTRANGEVI